MNEPATAPNVRSCTRLASTLALGACLLALLFAGSMLPQRAYAEESFYDPRPLGLMTPARDQEPWGTCWDFAGIAALESALVSSGLADNSIDLSEEAVFWSIMANCANEDGTYPLYGWSNTRRDTPGYNEMMTGYFATWQGPKLEADVPYYLGSDDDPDGAFYFETCPAGFEAAPIPFQVTDIAYLAGASSDEIKAAVRAYGAVVSGCELSLDRYRNDAVPDDGTLWSPGQGGVSLANHAVAIVGWDDAFDRANFAPAEDGSLPSTDGAWLVKNSSLTEGVAPYIWVSYDDDSLLAFGDHNPVYAIAGVRAAQNRIVHGLDENGAVSLSTAKDRLTCANVFEFSAGEQLREIMFMSLSAGARYRVLWAPVDGNGTPLPDDPSAFELASSTVPKAGYTTVELAEPRPVPVGAGTIVLEVFDTDVASVGLDANTLSDTGRPLYTTNRDDAGLSFFIDEGTATPALDKWGGHVNFSIRVFSTIESESADPAPLPEPEPKPEPTPLIPSDEGDEDPAAAIAPVAAVENGSTPVKALAPTNDPYAQTTSALAASCAIAGLLACMAVSRLRSTRRR